MCAENFATPTQYNTATGLQHPDSRAREGTNAEMYRVQEALLLAYVRADPPLPRAPGDKVRMYFRVGSRKVNLFVSTCTLIFL